MPTNGWTNIWSIAWLDGRSNGQQWQLIKAITRHHYDHKIAPLSLFYHSHQFYDSNTLSFLAHILCFLRRFFRHVCVVSTFLGLFSFVSFSFLFSFVFYILILHFSFAFLFSFLPFFFFSDSFSIFNLLFRSFFFPFFLSYILHTLLNFFFFYIFYLSFLFCFFISFYS